MFSGVRTWSYRAWVMLVEQYSTFSLEVILQATRTNEGKGLVKSAPLSSNFEHLEQRGKLVRLSGKPAKLQLQSTHHRFSRGMPEAWTAWPIEGSLP